MAGAAQATDTRVGWAGADRSLATRTRAEALGLWEAGIAGAIAIAPVIATAIIDTVGVSAGFMLSGAALIVIGAVAALALTRTRGRASSRTSTSSRTGPSEAVTSASAAGFPAWSMRFPRRIACSGTWRWPASGTRR